MGTDPASASTASMTRSAPAHGGDLRAARARFGHALEDWLDLSTGINPHPYPFRAPAMEAWHRLPEAEDGLEVAARRYYGSEDLLPLAGTQMAIKLLPRLRRPGRVLVAAPSYAEHAHAWAEAGHRVHSRPAQRIDDAAVGQADVVVLVHPNNPDGFRYALPRMERWRAQLAQRGGWLVVDEAFMDATPDQSMLRPWMPPALIVLRSFGKFFGLAGARLGFACAEPDLLAALADAAGPWAVAGPSRAVAQQALEDRVWQRRTCDWLEERSAVTRLLLERHGLRPAVSTPLFHWIPSDRAGQWQTALARHAVWTRRFEQPSALRIGLTANDADHARLEAALRAAGAEVAAA
ncbi:threonine-phosphate decarboxylase CobD [Algiphilus sp.]|uniref:threonine-phosphate decarboxylase CobD n=1 Tax=Algiphilus sp. TaxID=1872431 RepID=UPI003B52B8BF